MRAPGAPFSGNFATSDDPRPREMRKIAIRALLAPSLVGAFVGVAASTGCGIDVNPNDCNATNSCGNGDASPDGAQSDVVLSDAPEDGREAASEGGRDGGSTEGGSGDAPSDSAVQCDGSATQMCSGSCYPLNDPQHCGSCSNACSGPASGHGSPTCASPPTCGVSCSSGYHQCGTPADCLADTDPPSAGGDPCIINEQFGVFVSPAGDDSAAGSQLAPVKTIGKAMDLAKTAGKHVYACGNNGTYNENLVVDSGRDGVNVYGGLDCTTTPSQWKYVAANLASVAPTTAGYALELQGLTTGVTFEDFGFSSLAGVNPGDSSIAVFATSSSGPAVLRRTTISAGAGVNGQDQSQPNPYLSAAPNGNAGTAVSGGALDPNPACNTSTGGAGGQPSATGGNDGNDGTPLGSNNKGIASAQNCAGPSTGGNGVTGGAGSDQPGASTWAAFTSSGWAPAAGQTGSSGSVGQGGGGGASLDITGGGGSGGAGGCGGVGGGAGSGGGSSVAVLLYQASLDLESCTLNASSAGRGGNGAAGQIGQTGGSHGAGSANACQGGKGGNGGNGGGGGGGAGGLSAGVVWLTTAPTINGSQVTSAATLSGVNTAATGGVAGAGGGASNSGKAGTAAAVVQFQ